MLSRFDYRTQCITVKAFLASRTVEKGGRGGKRSRARAPKGPVNILCHRILLLLYIFAVHFYGNVSALKGAFARTFDFDDSIHDTNQTVVLIFLIYISKLVQRVSS